MVDKSLSKSLLVSVQAAYKVLNDNDFNEGLIEASAAHVDPIVKFFNITPGQALVLGFFVSQNINDNEIDRECFTKYFSKEISSLPDALELIDSLAEKKLIFKCGDISKKSVYKFKFIRVHPRVIRAIINGDIEQLQLTPCETFMEFLDDVNDVVVQRMERHINTEQLMSEIKVLMEVNKHLESVQWINRQEELIDINLCLFLNICIEHARGQEEVDCEKVIREVCDNATHRMRHKSLMKSGQHFLVKRGYIEFCGSFIALFDSVKIQDDVMKQVFSGSPDTIKREFKPKNSILIDFESIQNEQLYYNSNEGQSIHTLTEILSDKRYHEVVEKMKSKNMKPGFTILLYGAPGTGKTSTAKQIAKTTGRSILMVDIPSIQSKWLGESERNLSRLWDEYEQAKSRFSIAPILLFNEADALLGKRVNVNTSVDQINNTLQNILLQRLEDFEGIFIATTNLLKNLESSFDRRFLYKIEFCKPESSVRLQILQSRFPEISSKILEEINERFELTGGQISNISRKLLVNQLLNKESDDAEQLFTMCEEEVRLRKTVHSNPIGFRTGH